MGYSWLTNNVSIVFTEQERDSVIHIHVSILPQTPLQFKLPHNIEKSSLLYSKPFFVIYFKYSSMYREALSKVRDELSEQETRTETTHTHRHTHTHAHTCWWMNGTIGTQLHMQTQAAVCGGLCPFHCHIFKRNQPSSSPGEGSVQGPVSAFVLDDGEKLPGHGYEITFYF